MGFVHSVEGGSELVVRAKPRASRSKVMGVRPASNATEGEVLEVRLAATPVKGAANAELLVLLASALRIPRRDLELVQGASGRTKRLRIHGLSRGDVLDRLGLRT